MERCEIEYNNFKEFDYLLSIDEAGRGPLAGPVTIAGILSDKESFFNIDNLDFLNDSKKVSQKKRILLEAQIKQIVEKYEICDIDVNIIDDINIYEATKIGIIQVCKGILLNSNINNVCILIDGTFKNIDIMFKEIMKIKYKLICIPHGDELCSTISAASILAKVHRDKVMEKYDIIYPMYGFKNHKGYGSKYHLETLIKYGSCSIHRKSFSPIKLYPEKDNNYPDFNNLGLKNSKKFKHYYDIGKDIEKNDIKYKSRDIKIGNRIVRYIDLINNIKKNNHNIKISDISQMSNKNFEILIETLKIEYSI